MCSFRLLHSLLLLLPSGRWMRVVQPEVLPTCISTYILNMLFATNEYIRKPGLRWEVVVNCVTISEFMSITIHHMTVHSTSTIVINSGLLLNNPK